MWKIFIAFIFCCSIGYAQEKSSYRELIVQVPELTEWKVYKISKQLACLDGLRFLGYFKERSCLLLHVFRQLSLSYYQNRICKILTN